MDDEKRRIDPMILHILIWFVLTVGLYAAFFVGYGARLVEFIAFLAGQHPALP